MTEADSIKAGISALQSGDRAKAATLFAQVVKQNPMSEQGWFLLGMSVASHEQREYCLKRALAINPNNEHARRQLAQLSPQPAAPSPRPEPISQSRQPFVEESKPVAASAPVVVEKPHPVERKRTSTPKKKGFPASLSIRLWPLFLLGYAPWGESFISSVTVFQPHRAVPGCRACHSNPASCAIHSHICAGHTHCNTKSAANSGIHAAIRESLLLVRDIRRHGCPLWIRNRPRKPQWRPDRYNSAGCGGLQGGKIHEIRR